MNTADELDQHLLARLKASAEKHGFTPEALLLAGESAAEFQRIALIPILGPFPSATDEVTISEEVLANWPAWVSELVPPGSKFERLHWPDGTTTIRLVNHHSLVLAAKLLPA